LASIFFCPVLKRKKLPSLQKPVSLVPLEVQAGPALFVPHFQVRYRIKIGFIFQKLIQGILRYLIGKSFCFPLFPHHVFHPRDLHFLKNSPKRRKYCFSVSLNSLFRCLRSLVESWYIQYVVILNVSDMIIENISGRVSGLCGWMKVSQKPLPVKYWIPAHFRSMPDFKPVEFDGLGLECRDSIINIREVEFHIPLRRFVPRLWNCLSSIRCPNWADTVCPIGDSVDFFRVFLRK
jgi:hypothetical protein